MRSARGAIVIGMILVASCLWALGDESGAGSQSWFRWDSVALALLGAGAAAVLSGIGSSIGIGIAGGMAACPACSACRCKWFPWGPTRRSPLLGMTTPRSRHGWARYLL